MSSNHTPTRTATMIMTINTVGSAMAGRMGPFVAT